MKNTLVVVTDLGGFKAFKLNRDGMNRSPKLDLLEEFNNSAAHVRLVEKVSDLAGRFPRTAGVMSDGERHNIELEERKRGVRKLAGKLNGLLRDNEYDQCWLAASREMNHLLLDELDPQARAKIGLNIPADLMKVNRSDLLRHFR